jgi:hypothetical protein
VRDAVVIAREDIPGDKRLVAYVTSLGEAPTDLVATLRQHVAARLPEYMVPAAFVRLDALPLTPNGKLDRKALPAPDAGAVMQRAYEAPQVDVEQTLATLWQELLGIERVGRHDNFFELGGHSLLAVRAVNRLQGAMGVALPIATLFARPRLADLAEAICAAIDSGGARALTPIARVSREASLQLSFAQQRLWFLAQLDGVSATYHIALRIRMRGALDRVAWRRSLDRLVARHEALRSVFVSAGGAPHVELLPASRGFTLTEDNLEQDPSAEHRLEELCEQQARATFDLATGPLIRGQLIRLAPEDHVFVLTQHHIVSDGWSVDVQLRELSALYGAFVAGQQDPLPPLALQYPDYAAWQRQWLSGARLATLVEYWSQSLANAPALLELPTDQPRPAQQSFAGGFVEV